MKDRVELRFTIATSKIETKAIKTLAKFFENKVERVTESITKAVETIVEEETKARIPQEETGITETQAKELKETLSKLANLLEVK